MSDSNAVSIHYTHGALLDAIREGIEKLGKSLESVSFEDLAPVEEFHIGGRAATQDFLDQLDLSSGDHVLDVGCALGGSARFAASHYGCRVTGIDLTREYVETGRVLCSWVGLEDQVVLEEGNATATPFMDGTFEKAYMLHVGMNIPDKRALASELHRVLAPGGRLGIYDVMRIGEGDLTFPVPWAASADTSAVASPDEYKAALEAAGFRITAERNRREFALQFFEKMKELAASADGPPPLGMHLLMGETRTIKVENMIENVSASRIAPVELIAEK